MTKRIPELDAAIKWKTFFDLLSQKSFREERDKGVVAAIFCLSKYPPTLETVVRWKALCDVLEKDPFKIDTPRRGIIAALLLLSVQK
ncbi:MAG: hypothetical protein ACTSXO_08985 [Candidatus Heimdallarchaeota archaeon]|nr:hypothetical protein [Candidatus Heimdallarchaeota archaeon]RLI67162.1 MAG: hypothetical protein DRO63_05335 [Candidatus Gerdarchaeota archaeon]RLI68297.1 MAG: hypothetical protein DRP02_12850 [Candidatus Gerdarchaeota archaeon]